MMGAVTVPLAAAGFVTPVKHVMRTTLASTALAALHGENSPASLLSQRGVTAIILTQIKLHKWYKAFVMVFA